MLRTGLGLALIAAFALGVFTLHTDLRELQLTYPDEYRSYFIPGSAQMKVMSLGYRGLWADLIFIWAIQYYDWYNRSVRWGYLEHTFDVITDLDPKYQDAYIVGALFAFMGLKWDIIYGLQDKGIRLNPENYVIPYDAGTTAYFSEKNCARAAKYFRIALERKPGHGLIVNLLAKATACSGDTESSLAFWRELIAQYEGQDTPEANYYRGAAARHIWNTLIQRDQDRVAAAVAAYRESRGIGPPGLKSLVIGGFLPSVPRDPAGNPYAYDRVTGSITCTTPFDVRAKLGQW